MMNYQWVKKEIEKLHTAKVIWSSRSSWSAPIIVVPKGDRGKWLVITYQALNKVTRKFTWPMSKVKISFPNWMEQSIFQLWIWELVIIIYLWFSLWYLKQHSTLPLASMNTSRYLWISSGCSIFQELMTGILKDFDFTIAYLDDIKNF